MSKKIFVDARGRSCPEPVVMTRQAVEQLHGDEEEVIINVDNPVALENVKRLLQGNGYRCAIRELEGYYEIAVQQNAAEE